MVASVNGACDLSVSLDIGRRTANKHKMMPADDLVDTLHRVQSVARLSDSYTKFTVRDNQLCIDHSYQSIGTVGRHILSMFYTGYSRKDVCRFFARLLDRCVHVLRGLKDLDDCLYTYRNFAVHSIVSDDLCTAMVLARSIIDSVPHLTILAATLRTTYADDAAVQRVSLRLGVFIERVHRRVQPFYTKYVASGYVPA